jgi:integrase
MSFNLSLPYRLWTCRLSSGEARAFLLDSQGLPDDYSTLYVTCKLRNTGKSVASQEAALNAINILYSHCLQQKIDLVLRFKQGQFLDRWEVEALRGVVQRSFGPEQKARAKVIELGKGKKGHAYRPQMVKSETQRSRLTYIARYLEWLAHELNATRENSRSVDINAMCRHVLAIRPDGKTFGEDVDNNLFTVDQNEILNHVIEPSSTQNPFDPKVQLRNKLLVYLLRSLGKRRGEVLNIRLSDIHFSQHRIDIVRRADDRNDPRIKQPLVKTREHSVPLYPEMEALIEQYLLARRQVPGARKHPYLLVTHQSGPTQGQPMTIAALNKVFRVLKVSHPELKSIHPHLLRHFHGDTMAKVQLDRPQTVQSRETDRRTRNFLAGRRPESGVDATYTARTISQQASKVSMRTQQETMKAVYLPKAKGDKA